MSKIYNNVGDLIGNTPLVRINKLNDGGAEVLAVALRLSRLPENKGKRIVALLPDSGERYLSTWLFE